MPHLVRFGQFVLDLETGDLHRNGERIRLPEQQLQILEALIQREGGLVSREDIRKRLWPNDTIVEFDRSINAAIMSFAACLVSRSAEEDRLTAHHRASRGSGEAVLPRLAMSASKPRPLVSSCSVRARAIAVRIAAGSIVTELPSV